MAGQYLRFDEVEDVLSSLDLLAHCAPLLSKKPSYWKWAIISGHAALQGAMVCALHDTSNLSVLDKISTRKMREWLDQPTGDPPQERLAYFNTLLERCRASDHMKGQPLNLSPSQLKDVGRLHNEFQNGFTHFVPQGWSIAKAGLPRIVCTAVDATETLMAHPNVTHKLTGNRRRRLASSLAIVRRRLG